ncbi:sensor domain-containing diguanylate cyclase [Thiocystis violacea]|uniref:sensor domain-containing diguanylate cyclase n=1 Tax=Thiocystis violacea TaxID=13725 RepID=UPI001906ABA1|nr:diguanylate cyclase [Thiocystis violacea]
MFQNAHQSARLRLLFLIPLAVAILGIVATLTLTLSSHEQASVQDGVIRLRASAEDFYNQSILYDAHALQAVMDVLEDNVPLRAALAAGDRDRLLALGAPPFERLKRDFSITHLYFTRPDRVNLLRVHAPDRAGDRIDRITTLAAERDQASAFGVEIGPLGTFTLRLVAPWHDRTSGKLIGYVELGMEIDRVLQALRDVFGVYVIVLIHKDVLDRARWEEGMRTLGRVPDWERFPSVVVGRQTPDEIPDAIGAYLSGHSLEELNAIISGNLGGQAYRLAFLPLRDVGNRHVAHLVLFMDVTKETRAAARTVYQGTGIALGIGCLLFLFFNWHIGRIGRRLETDERALRQLATRDGLTGLYNHRTFYLFVKKEIARIRRYGGEVAVVLLDIDHFKRINDTHGHQAGDAILRGLSKRLQDAVRDVDCVCRYGGEEITVILPNCEKPRLVAERLRIAIAATPFSIDDGQAIRITASIGVATYPSGADSVDTLVSAADAAMYAAKEAGRNQVRAHAPAPEPGATTQRDEMGS